MLPVVLRAIFESPTVQQRNQLPLAIRYNDHNNVKKVLDNAGIKMSDNPADELAVDGRQLIYAAFYDNAKIVREMLQGGFEVKHLDHLIALEIRQEMARQQLLQQGAKSSCCGIAWKRGGQPWHSAPMPGWKEREHRHGHDEEAADKRWSALPVDTQVSYALQEIQSVTWDKMAFVPGWTYRTICQSKQQAVVTKATEFLKEMEEPELKKELERRELDTGGNEKDHLSRLETAIAEEVKGSYVEIRAGTIFRQTAARKSHPTKMRHTRGETLTGKEFCQHVGVVADEIELVCSNAVPNPRYKGADAKPAEGQRPEPPEITLGKMWADVITEEQAERQVKRGRNDGADSGVRSLDRMLQWANATARRQDGSDVYVKLEDETLGWIVLRRERTDEIVGCLELGGQKDRESEGTRRNYLRSNVGALMYDRAELAFAPWLKESEPELDLLEQPFDPLLRIYWAIATRRDNLAKVFWMDASNPEVFQPFVGAFLGSFMYKSMGVGYRTGIRSKGRSRLMMKAKWDQFAADLLDCMEGSGNVLDSGSEVFDKYVFFGEDEEEEYDPDSADSAREAVCKFGLLSDEQKHSNRTLRSALRIMGSDARTELTHVDLALVADNKAFMGHRYTANFVDDVWKSACANDKWLHQYLGSTPRAKYFTALLGLVAFLTLYAYVYTGYEYPSVVRAAQNCEGDRCPPLHFQGTPAMRVAEGVFWMWVVALFGSEIHQYRSDFDSFAAYLHASGNQVRQHRTRLQLTAGTDKLCFLSTDGYGDHGSVRRGGGLPSPWCGSNLLRISQSRSLTSARNLHRS